METDTNLTASAGDTVVLVCRVENLGTREVRDKFCYTGDIFFNYQIHIYIIIFYIFFCLAI